MLCEVTDTTVIDDPMTGRSATPTTGSRTDRRDRAIRLANELCDLVQVRSGPARHHRPDPHPCHPAASAEWLRANRRSPNGSGAPIRYLPHALTQGRGSFRGGRARRGRDTEDVGGPPLPVDQCLGEVGQPQLVAAGVAAERGERVVHVQLGRNGPGCPWPVR